MLNTIGNIVGYTLVFIFALGWIDIGFGPEYTWWNVIYQLGNM